MKSFEQVPVDRNLLVEIRPSDSDAQLPLPTIAAIEVVRE